MMFNLKITDMTFADWLTNNASGFDHHDTEFDYEEWLEEQIEMADMLSDERMGK